MGRREGLEGLLRSPSGPQKVPAAELLRCLELSSAPAVDFPSPRVGSRTGPALPSHCLGQSSARKAPSALSPHHEAPQQLAGWAQPRGLAGRCFSFLVFSGIPTPLVAENPHIYSFGVVPSCSVTLLPCRGVLQLG